MSNQATTLAQHPRGDWYVSSDRDDGEYTPAWLKALEQFLRSALLWLAPAFGIGVLLRFLDVLPKELNELVLLLGTLLCLALLFWFGLASSGIGSRQNTEAAPDPTPIPPGRQPWHRRWQHDVYDENAYAILGVPQDAALAEIRAAFKQLVQQYHPDAVPPAEKERAALVFVRIDQAYELLSHAEHRARYNAWIEHQEGREPLLDDATAVFRDAERLAHFDETFRTIIPELPPNSAAATPVPASSLAAGGSAEPSVADREESSSPSAPVEVEMPEAVREALGLPSRGPVVQCGRCGAVMSLSDSDRLFCPQCSPTGGC